MEKVLEFLGHLFVTQVHLQTISTCYETKHIISRVMHMHCLSQHSSIFL